ncbi:hypothetical protein [Actomonas aquatica]|uniref:Uncharacterized protein n=1 Tax=Actomonas aquatica TaxID=2866162 RepID=A0ABZ1CBB9_9BACT|nr:hypothetical protein [Opitutus sp. WL0086]WRQ88851.1 hypothetical protein K1X11_005500 [Opitutus sp. WL0086]
MTDTILHVCASALSIAMVVVFVGGFTASITLLFFGDPEAIEKRRTTSSLFLGSPMTPIECYKQEAWIMWKIRDRCFKAFLISVLVWVLLYAVSMFMEAPILSAPIK